MENPVGLDGIEFVEFTSPEPQKLEQLFDQLGFKKIGVHKKKNVHLFRQGDVNFILNNENDSFGETFKKHHGPSICATGFRVKNADHAMKTVLERGGRKFEGEKKGPQGKPIPAMYGIGDSLIYFVDTYGKNTIYDEDFNYITEDRQVPGVGFVRVDHLTNNVFRGNMERWKEFYERVFNFRQIRYFDIKGKKTGLVSHALTSPCGKIVIPINESTDGKSQIQEYLEEYKGEGIQHLAMLTDDILSTVEKLKARGIEFLDTPDTYFDMIPERVPNVREPMNRIRENRILVDGDEKGYLLQIFTKNLVGPIFLEIIQRKGHQGFGEGNFQALFDAIERDQMDRGVL